MQSLTPRISWIDILRGIAIILMIPANLSLLWSQPHPLWFRILASFAAPIFIMLSTGMVILNANKYHLKHFFQRGLIIIGFAICMDICIWKIFPFVTYDVLYLIGFALPIIYLARHFSITKLVILGTIIFILTPLLQQLFGYHLEISEITWAHPYWPGTFRLFQSWLIDGWFPVFPWLGVAFFGAAFFRIIFLNKGYLITKKMVLFSSIVILIGFFLLFIPTNEFNNVTNHGIMAERGGFSEIFYPPTLAYLITAIGMVIILARLAQYFAKFTFSKVLSLFGRFSLFIYLLHQAIAVFLITPILNTYGMQSITSGLLFTSSVLLTLFAIYFICLLIDRLKQTYLPSSLILQMLVGK